MSNHPDSTAAFASIGELSKNIVERLDRPRDRDVAAAMRELESQVHDLFHMARITADVAEQCFDRADRVVDDRKVFSFQVDELDAFLFALNNVETRARDFRTAYLAAFDGRAAQ
jgi:uncharacterized protein (DUF1778 family)